MKTRVYLAVAAVIGPLLTACGPAVLVGTGAVVTHTVVEERSTMDALKDTEVKVSIENALLNHSGALFRDVNVTVVEGRVLLVGGVPNEADKALASKIAWDTQGANAVENDLVVGPGTGTGTYLEDVRISNELRLALLRDTSIASQNYDVVTYNHVVHLAGLALSPDELERAINTARKIDGVTKVVSHVLTIDDPRRVRVTAATG